MAVDDEEQRARKKKEILEKMLRQAEQAGSKPLPAGRKLPLAPAPHPPAPEQPIPRREQPLPPQPQARQKPQGAEQKKSFLSSLFGGPKREGAKAQQPTLEQLRQPPITAPQQPKPPAPAKPAAQPAPASAPPKLPITQPIPPKPPQQAKPPAPPAPRSAAQKQEIAKGPQPLQKFVSPIKEQKAEQQKPSFLSALFGGRKAQQPGAQALQKPQPQAAKIPPAPAPAPQAQAAKIPPAPKPAQKQPPPQKEEKPKLSDYLMPLPKSKAAQLPGEKPAQQPMRQAVTLAQQKPAAKPAKPGGLGTFLDSLAGRISNSFPNLRRRLREAGMPDDAVAFIRKSLVYAAMLTALLLVLSYLILDIYNGNKLVLIPLLPVLFMLAFAYVMQFPTSKAIKRARETDRELVFACRQMLIELKAGVPLFDAMLSISRDYGEISKEFSKIVERVNAGVPTDLAMSEVADSNPSQSFRRVILQLINSIRSGSDVATALESVLDQVTREQVTELKAYGQKLNPLAMFYMIFGIIMPSLGVALAIIMLSFLGVRIDTTLLYASLGIVVFIQYIFTTLVESSKPSYEF